MSGQKSSQKIESILFFFQEGKKSIFFRIGGQKGVTFNRGRRHTRFLLVANLYDLTSRAHIVVSFQSEHFQTVNFF